MAQANLHDEAVTAQSSLNHLATGLAQAGVPPEVVAAVKKMATVMTKIVRILGQPAPEAPQPQQPPAQAAPQQPQTIDAATQHLHQVMQQSAQNGGR